MTNTMLKILKVLLYVACFAFFAWILISWWDIVADNSMPNPVHYSWNFFTVMIGM